MRFVLVFYILGIICQSSVASARYNPSQLATLYACEPNQPTQSIVSVSVLEDKDSKEQFLSIKWPSPTYREKVEVGSAEYIDDFTVSGYYSERLKAGLYFYTEDDEAGERNVLKFEGKKEISLKCKWVGSHGTKRSP